MTVTYQFEVASYIRHVDSPYEKVRQILDERDITSELSEIDKSGLRATFQLVAERPLPLEVLRELRDLSSLEVRVTKVMF